MDKCVCGLLVDGLLQIKFWPRIVQRSNFYDEQDQWMINEFGVLIMFYQFGWNTKYLNLERFHLLNRGSKTNLNNIITY